MERGIRWGRWSRGKRRGSIALGVAAFTGAAAACGAFTGSGNDTAQAQDGAAAADAATSDGANGSSDATATVDGGGGADATATTDAATVRFCDTMRDAIACWDFDGIDPGFSYFEMPGTHAIVAADASPPNALQMILYEAGVGKAEVATASNEQGANPRLRIDCDVKIVQRDTPAATIGVLRLVGAGGLGAYVYLAQDPSGAGFFARSSDAGDQVFPVNTTFSFVSNRWFHVAMILDWSDGGTAATVTAHVDTFTETDVINGLIPPFDLKVGPYNGGENGNTSVLYDNIVVTAE